jgi:hypothetical protein
MPKPEIIQPETQKEKEESVQPQIQKIEKTAQPEINEAGMKLLWEIMSASKTQEPLKRLEYISRRLGELKVAKGQKP